MAAISVGFPSLPRGIIFLTRSWSSSAVMSLSMNPGQTAFTVMPRDANSFAMVIVMPSTPAFTSRVEGTDGK